MSLPADVSRSLTRRMLDGELPAPVYAVVGLVDEVSGQARQVVSAATAAPAGLASAALAQYSALVQRGQDRSIEIAAERAVRDRVSRFEDRVAPAAARASVRVNERRKQWNNSRVSDRAATARARARAAAERFNELNSPVLADDDLV